MYCNFEAQGRVRLTVAGVVTSMFKGLSSASARGAKSSDAAAKIEKCMVCVSWEVNVVVKDQLKVHDDGIP